MNTKRTIMIAAALVLAACTQRENPIETRVPVLLSYNTVSATETKAAQNLNEGTFASGETIMVRICETGSDDWTDYAFTTGDAGAMQAPDPGPYYTSGSVRLDIAACYPSTAGSSFTVAANQTADADYKASDLMFASVTNQARQTEAVELAFSHKMAKFCLNITAGEGVSSITGVKILKVKPTVSFNPCTGEVGEAEGAPVGIAVSSSGAAVIPAQTLDGNLLAVKTDKGTATYSVAGMRFEAGKVYTLNITVNSLSVGATIPITGWTDWDAVTVSPTIVASSAPAGVVAVDLGLSVKWANMNLGATSPRDAGSLFAWGEPAAKTYFGFENYLWCQGSWLNITKYCVEDVNGNWWWDKTGATVPMDHKTRLEPGDDAAHVNWGGGWRMPTADEVTELLEKCTWKWTYEGERITSNVPGYEGVSILLPLTGIGMESQVEYKGHYANYWTSSLVVEHPLEAYVLNFLMNYYEGDKIYTRLWQEHRDWGCAIRPVIE